jgi:hypothetical protein
VNANPLFAGIAPLQHLMLRLIAPRRINTPLTMP